MSKWQRYALGVFAFLAWLILIGVSLTANFKFAFNLGHTELERYIMGAGSVASDLFKSAAFVAFLWMISRKNYSVAASVAVLGIVAGVFSVVAATGFAAGNRYEAYNDAQLKQQATKDMRKDIERAESQRDWQPTHKPLKVAEAELKALEQNPLYVASAYCNRQVGQKQEDHCRKVAEANVAASAAKVAEEQHANIVATRGKIASKGRDYGDAQIEFWSNWTGIKGDTILRMMIILQVLLIEVGSALGLTVALALLVPEGTALGKVLSIVKPAPAVRVPDASAIAKVAAAGGARSFKQPAADQPDGGGLRSKIRPISAAEVFAQAKAASAAIARRA
jgi:hypothetical protein